MQGSKVSIIIPVYKTEKFLRKCLDSVVNQTLQDIEIIIVDEGDMDECRSIIDEYERNDSRIKTIHEKNGGYGVSINKGFDLATGEYIGIVESDDFVDENMFEDLYKIAKDSDADIVKSDWIEYTESKNLCRQVGKINKTMTGKDLTAKTYPRLLSIQPSIWSAIYKKSFLNDNNIRFLSTPGGSYQDTSFTFKVMTLAPKIRLTSKAYLYYRQDNENSSVKNTGKVYAICDEYEEITRFLDEHKDIKCVCWQGQICAPNIQGNPHKLKDVHFYSFHMTDSKNGRYDIREAKKVWNKYDMEVVPIVSENYILPDDFELFKLSADGVYNKEVCEGAEDCLREGFVYYKTTDPTFSFKNVSRQYLISRNQ